MVIRGLCVCVGYAELLARTLCAWQESLDDLTIVTSPEDAATLDLCAHAHVRIHATRVFYDRGASFNKGAALEEARKRVEGADQSGPSPPSTLHSPLSTSPPWLLLFDADVLPERGWRSIAEAAVQGSIYGAHRYQAPVGQASCLPPGSPPSAPPSLASALADALCPPEDSFDACPMCHVLPDEIPGCFQLFHPSDPIVAQRTPVIPTDWSHAGDYDTEFCRLWPAAARVRLPIRLLHLGEPATYWHGVKPRDLAKAAMASMHTERRARHGWEHERIQKPLAK